MNKKTNYQSRIKMVNEISTIARNRGIAHLFTEDEKFDGKTIIIDGKPLLNFGSCSYLGLEMDNRLKEAAIDAINRYGTQFSSSRTYVSFTLYKELEELLGKIFTTPIILSSTTSLGHQAVIPIIVEDEDCVIMDHQAHISMQDVLPKLQVRGITTTLLRHSHLDELQNKIIELSPRHNRIWYFIDGIYSMYGDLSPLGDLVYLLNSNKQLHLYIDDAHGMSWAGKHGSGFALQQVPHHQRIILATSLAKAFGSAGGVFIIHNQDLYWRVKNWGGALTFSGPQQPAVIGASIASARIHLSEEICDKQAALAQRVQYCNDMLKHYNLPVITPSISPIFFIGLGLAKVGYNMVRRMINDGLYVNLGVFPAVPEMCTGIRFTLTVHQDFEDIERLVRRLAYHLPSALKDEDRTMEDIYRGFRSTKSLQKHVLDDQVQQLVNDVKPNGELLFEKKATIRDIPRNLWNQLQGNKGAFDWEGLALLEDSFKDNERVEDNWQFHYYIIRDVDQKPILATFFTSLLTKTDMLSPADISMKMEQQRFNDSYYMTSLTLMMGTLVTEGQHLYLDRANSKWKRALMLLLDALWAEQDSRQIPLLYLRDFEVEDTELRNFMIDQGFVPVDMPHSHVIENLEYNSIAEYISQLQAKKRYHIRKDVLSEIDHFEVACITQASESELDHLYRLYENVAERGFEINTFKLPKKLFKNIIHSPGWDVIVLRLKQHPDQQVASMPIAVEFSYRQNNYYPSLIGLDYKYLENRKVYKQLLYQIVRRAIELRCKKLYFGLTASLEKRKLGAIVKSNVAYVQIKDNYDQSLLNMVFPDFSRIL